MDRSRGFAMLLLRVLAGPLIWAGHLLAIYAFTALACARGWGQGAGPGFGLVPIAITLLTVIAMLGIIAAMLARPSFQGMSEETRRFLRWIGIAFGLLSLIAVAWSGLPALVVTACRSS